MGVRHGFGQRFRHLWIGFPDSEIQTSRGRRDLSNKNGDVISALVKSEVMKNGGCYLVILDSFFFCFCGFCFALLFLFCRLECATLKNRREQLLNS